MSTEQGQNSVPEQNNVLAQMINIQELFDEASASTSKKHTGSRTVTLKKPNQSQTSPPSSKQSSLKKQSSSAKPNRQQKNEAVDKRNRNDYQSFEDQNKPLSKKKRGGYQLSGKLEMTQLDYVSGISSSVLVSPSQKKSYQRGSEMSVRSSHAQTPSNLVSNGHMKKRTGQTMHVEQQVMKTANRDTDAVSKISTMYPFVPGTQQHNQMKTLVPIYRDSDERSSLFKDYKNNSLDSKISLKKQLPITKYRAAGQGVAQSMNSKTLRVFHKKKATPTQQFVARNQGIQRILMQGQQAARSVNFDIFKKSDNPDTAYIGNSMNSNAQFAQKLGYRSPADLARTMTNFSTSSTKKQSSIGRPDGVTENIHKMMNMTEMPKLKPIETVSDTMKHMMTTHNNNQSVIGGSIKQGAFQLMPLAERSIEGRQRLDTNSSQTVSSGFFDQVGQGNLRGNMRLTKGSKLHDIEETRISVVQSSLNKQSVVQNDMYKRGSQMISKNMKNSQYRTEQSVESASDQISDQKYRVEVEDNNLGTMRLETLQDTFEAHNFVDQAKVMRIGLNEQRLDRFLGLYESNQPNLHKKIRDFGTNNVSKSIDASGRLRNPHKLLMSNMAQNFGKKGTQLNINSARSRQYLNRISQSVLLQKQTQMNMSNQQLVPNNITTKQTEPVTFLSPADQKCRSKMGNAAYDRFNSPPKIEPAVPIKQPIKTKAYLPPTRNFAESNDTVLLMSDGQTVQVTPSRSQLDEKFVGYVKRPANTQLSMNSIGNYSKMGGPAGNLANKKSLMQRTLAMSVSQRKVFEDLVADITQESMNKDEDFVMSLQRQKMALPIGVEEMVEDVSSFSETSSDGYSSVSNNSIKKKARYVDEESDESLSVNIHEKNQHAERHNLYIEDLFSKTKKFADEQNTKAQSRLMVGKSLFEFPNLKTLQEHSMKQVQTNFENETKKVLGNETSFGLAMVGHEKDENYKADEPPHEINNHIQFLTDDMRNETGGEQAIFKKNTLIKKPGATYTFLELCEIEYRLMQDNSNEFEKKILYQIINKAANKPLTEEQFNEHPEYIYYMECSRDTDTPLPILSHIFNNTLTLANYTLSGGHCQALNRAAKYLQNNINRVRFDNCGIDDGEMANLLEAFCKFKDFKSIIYRQNDLQEESLEGLKILLAKGIPYHLQELRISNCRLTPQVTTDLIEAIAKKSYLKQFELANAPLSEENIVSIAEYVMSSRQLEDLDLSFNGMGSNKMELLFSYIKDNKKLSSLNFSHNLLIEGMSGNNMTQVLETEARVSSYLFQFLRTNRKLVHIDMTSTNLSESVILNILPAIKKAINLQGIHLSGNPGVTDNVKEQAKTLLKTKPKHNRERLNLQKVLHQNTMKALQKTFLRESVKIKQINNGKRIVQNGATDDKFFDIETKLILMRYLHHKKEIPGSGQWQIMTKKNEHCWLCDKEAKGFIFWSPQMGQISDKVLKISEDEKMNIYNELDQIQAHREIISAKPMPYCPPTPEVSPGRKPKHREPLPVPQPGLRIDPVICGQFTGWQSKPMLRLEDFLTSYCKEEDKLDYPTVFKYFCDNWKFGSQYKIENIDECTQHHYKMMDQYISDMTLDRYSDWQNALERVFMYKKPFFVNSHDVKNLAFDQIYIQPVFAKSGRQAFVIQSGETHKTVELYKTVIDFRQEEIAVPGNTDNESTVIFKKPVSVFAKWNTDTDIIKSKCLEHDFESWKLDNFELKNYEQQRAVKEIIDQNFYLLKAIFIEIAAETAFPKMTQLGLSSFVVRCKLIDNVHLKISDIDRNFIASRIEKGGKIKDQNIVRFMFFEALCRIGFKRFYDEGKGECSTKAEAIQATIDTIKQNWNTANWEGWRWKELYQVPIHEIFQSNLTQIRMLYNSYKKTNKKYMDLDDCYRMFSQLGSSSGIANTHVQWCFGMSKMTMVFERDKKASPAYTDIDQVEFLELIGRMAHLKFQGSELDLLKLTPKLELLLDDLFQLIDVTRNEREEDEDQVESEDNAEDSDY